MDPLPQNTQGVSDQWQSICWQNEVFTHKIIQLTDSIGSRKFCIHKFACSLNFFFFLTNRQKISIYGTSVLIGRYKVAEDFKSANPMLPAGAEEQGSLSCLFSSQAVAYAYFKVCVMPSSL